MTHTLSSFDVAAGRPGPVAGDPIRIEPVPPLRLLRAKKAYTTRFLADRLDRSPDGFSLREGPGVAPQAGDIVLAKVAGIGQHPKLESPVSRRQALFIGDEILVPYGNRYAADQFLAQVPPSLDPCHLVAAGGVAGLVIAQHAAMGTATRITPVGLLADDSGVVNLRQLAPQQLDPTATTTPRDAAPVQRPPVIAVLGTSMNSGKSTALSCLARGLTEAGLAVAAGKATGTGSGNDPGMYVDAGAAKVMDFTDFGFPTTFGLDYASIQAVFSGLVAELSDPATDVVLIEIADGVYQGETHRLLSDPLFRDAVDAVVFTAADALGATAGLQVLRAAGIPIAAVSGVLTSSPIAAQEASAAVNVPVVQTVSLCEPSVAVTLLPQAADG
ncbi:DUF1611 domain-containing protein [Arthrobacter sp. I2-34]|uniref:DUF1611 domain-containing protein n=1 Tax=Arthrobacter hankyongi TaxID=2904801 RepID=A0ABS9LCW3_9MICC|nr:DUF1611 domain-containing protein [Arthrobacter hankyongi]MCG2624534.1 DUF1611 domain-containing protein [Arthrobacter hankyongi]